MAHCAGADAAWEVDDEWDADAAFVEAAFPTAQARGAVEERGVNTTHVEVGIRPARQGGAVVAREDDEGAIRDARLVESGANSSHVSVEIGDHGCVTGPGPGMRQISALAAVGFGVPSLGKPFDRGARGMHCHMRFDEWQVEKERPVLVLANELDGGLEHEGWGIVLADPVLDPDFALGLGLVTRDGTFIDGESLRVAPEMGRVEAVGHRLAVVPVEQVESVAVGIARAAHRPQTPFAKGAGRVTSLLKNARQG